MLGADRDELMRLAKFLAVGGLNTLFGYSIFAALVLFGLGSSAAVIVATILGVLFNFQSTGRLVFGRSDSRLLPRFVMVYAVQMLANIGLLALAERLGAPVLLAQLLVLPPLVVVTYLLMRRFVFGTAGAAQRVGAR